MEGEPIGRFFTTANERKGKLGRMGNQEQEAWSPMLDFD